MWDEDYYNSFFLWYAPDGSVRRISHEFVVEYPMLWRAMSVLPSIYRIAIPIAKLINWWRRV